MSWGSPRQILRAKPNALESLINLFPQHYQSLIPPPRRGKAATPIFLYNERAPGGAQPNSVSDGDERKS
jgi:hypothetical protein